MTITDSKVKFILTTSPKILSISSHIKELLGFSADDFTSNRITFQSRIHADDQDLYDMLFAYPGSVCSDSARSDRADCGSFTIRLRQSDTRIRIVRLHYNRVISNDEAVLELLLQDAKSLYQANHDICSMMIAMMENTTDYVYFKDVNHVFTGASKTLLALCNSVRKWTDFLGKTDYDVFPEAYADIYYSLEKQIYSNTPVAHEIQKTLTVDGVEGWVDNRKFPVYNDDGEIVGLFGLARDITKLKQTQDKLHQMKKIIDTALDTQADTFFLFDAVTGKPIRWNNAFRDISGYTDAEIAVLPAPASYYSPADLKRSESIMQKVLNGKKINFEMELICKDGHKVLTEYSASAIIDKKGNPEFIISIGRDIRERKQAEEIVWHSANFDRLTDLPNRSLFFDRLSKVILKSKRHNQYAAILFLDLDGFKEANDMYGHEAGDHVLITVAERWLKCIRDVDTLARMGGDEFAVVIDSIPTPDTAAIIAKKMIDALASPIQLSTSQTHPSQACRIGVSIGISIYPQHATEMDTLLSTADVAMYASKSKGKNTFTFSSADPFSGSNAREWVILDDEHLVGWHDIDNEHQEIVRLVNQLNAAIQQGADNNAIGCQFEELANYTVCHFEHEHKLMKDFSYLGMENHDLVHEALIAQIQRLAREVQKGNGLLLLQTVKDWLLNHVLYYDQPLADFLNDQKVKK